VTLDEALAKADSKTSELIADARVATEDLLRNHGATDEEVAIELERFAAEAAALRAQASAIVRAMWETGSGIIH
jgi:hypothetical protein